jgi:RimJ/RimL family protein N-acetyltransferase
VAGLLNIEPLNSSEIQTERMILRPATEQDLDALLEVRLSNPERLARTDSSAGEPGRYDRGMLERDFAVAGFDPDRRLMSVWDRRDGTVIGLVDFLVKNPEDGVPWIGAIEIHATRQRRGYGREVAAAVGAGLSAYGERVRAMVESSDSASLSFAHRCGFAEVERRGSDLILEKRIRS